MIRKMLLNTSHYKNQELEVDIRLIYGMHPIYAQIQKRGYHGENGHDIYEYGWDFNYVENKSKPMAIVYEDDIQEAISILQHQPVADDMSVIIGKIT